MIPCTSKVTAGMQSSVSEFRAHFEDFLPPLVTVSKKKARKISKIDKIIQKLTHMRDDL